MKHRNALKKKYFQGEVIICAGCHRKLVSKPNVESGWAVGSVENIEPFYLCPQCFSDWINAIHNCFG